MSEDPIATHAGQLNIGDTTISCAVLENGQRVLTQDSFLHSIGRLARGRGGEGASASDLPVFLRAKNLEPYITPETRELSKPIVFTTTRNRKAYGYRAELLPVVCNIYLQARDDGVLKGQDHIALHCDMLVRGLAAVGIIALVDEATGYQYDRARHALEEILDRFISKELRKWAKTFPDEFYQEMFRLKGWSYVPWSIKRPGVVGRYTNDLVYERLAPGVLEELKIKNPPNQKGHRKHRHFQWLTEDVGHPRLREHLTAVMALMRASATWDKFYRMLQRAFPKYNTTLELPFSDYGDDNDK